MRTLRPARSRLKRNAAAVALCAATGIFAAQPAFADHDEWRHEHWRHHRRHYHPVYPPPVYYAPPPRPYYYAPPLVVYAPPPGLSITIPLR